MINKAEVRRFIVGYFSDDDLNALTFNYFPELLNEYTNGMTKSLKVRLLVKHADHYDRNSHLLSAVAGDSTTGNGPRRPRSRAA